MRWTEIARVLRPGGSYFAQQIGPATMAELVEYFIGPQPEKWAELHPDTQSAQAQAAGLQIVQMRMERMRAEFFDVGAVIYFLRKVIWTVPDFTRRPLSRAAARAARAHRGRRAVRRARDSAARRGPQAVATDRLPVTRPDATISRMSMAGMGLIGVAAGASTAGILGVMRLMGDHLFPRMASNSEHKHQMIASLQAQRHETVQQWRAGLATARDTYRQWAAGPRDHDAPNAVGDEWFEGLRPHLPIDRRSSRFRTLTKSTATTRLWHCCRWRSAGSNGEWVDEAKSYPRRRRTDLSCSARNTSSACCRSGG